MKIIIRAVYIFACALPAVLFCTVCGGLMLPLAIAIALHEAAHLVALRLQRGRLCGFRPAPFGLCIEYDGSSMSLLGEAIVCAAGCTVNLLLAVISYVAVIFLGMPMLDFCIVNLALCLINLLPVRQIDGGKLLEISIEFLFNERIAFAVCAIVTYAMGFFVFLLASYSLLTSQSGLYPLLFSIYLFVCNAKNLKKSVFNENGSI